MRRTRSDNTSGAPGVSFNKGAWQAEIRRGGKYLYQARFPTKEAAINARADAMLKLGIPERNLVRRSVDPPPPIDRARWVPLTKGYFALVDEADFPSVSALNWMYSGGYAKHKNRETGVTVSLQAFIMKPPLGLEVDHADRNRLDCRRRNLRLGTHAQNSQNTGKRRHNKSGFVGVHWDKRRGGWVAQAAANGEHVYLGRFDSAEEAARVRDAWVREHHGDFASLNFPEVGGTEENPQCRPSAALLATSRRT